MAGREVRIIGLAGLPELAPGDDLASLIIDAAARQGTPLQAGDVLVVTQKAISKAEGRLLDLRTIEPSPFARHLAQGYDKDPRVVEVILRESRRIVRMERGVLITETRHGFVCANAGVDASNVAQDDTVSLLPEDPDRSAAALRAAVREKLGVEVAVVISDSFGRPWREGVANVAVGVAGMLALRDYTGQRDPHGYTLRVTVMAVADELAAAAELAMGKLERVPAAIVRGYDYPQGCGKAADLVRPPELDLFR